MAGYNLMTTRNNVIFLLRICCIISFMSGHSNDDMFLHSGVGIAVVVLVLFIIALGGCVVLIVYRYKSKKVKKALFHVVFLLVSNP